MVVKTFRGLLADSGQDRIRLSTIKGKVGYRIFKLELMTNSPGIGNEAEHVLKIYKDEQSSIDGVIDFTDSTLLGAAFLPVKTSLFSQELIVTFDREMFNQDIYVTHKDNGGNAVPCNYYLELEVIPLDDAGAEYTTLKDMRST